MQTPRKLELQVVSAYSTVYVDWRLFRIEFFHRLIAGVVFLQQVAVFIELLRLTVSSVVFFLDEDGVVGGDGAGYDGMEEKVVGHWC